MRSIRVRTIGKRAAEVLQQPGVGILLGNTSKGIFIRVNENQIIFVSREEFNGPLTITLHEPALLTKFEPESIIIDKMTIQLGGELTIDLRKPFVWESDPIPPKIIPSPDLRIAREVGKLALSDQKTDLPVCLLAQLSLDGFVVEIQETRWTPVIRAIANHSEPEFIQALEGIVGYGRGLTPSGDDFILGYLLGVARYGSVLGWKGTSTSQIYQLLQNFSQTTLISQQLIYSATLGEADERLIRSIDGWMYNTLSELQIYSLLKTWGNSSGLDAFTGWVCALIMKELI